MGRLALVATALMLAAVLVPVLVTATWRADQDATTQRDRYGTTVVGRLAASAAEPLLDSDRIGLSVLTRAFAAFDGVATAAVYSADNRLLAASDARAASPAELEARPAAAVYVHQITLQDSIAGYARIGLDRDAFAPTGGALLLAVAVSTSVLMLALAWLIGGRFERRLARLRTRLEDELGQRALAPDALGGLGELLDPPAPPDPAVEIETGEFDLDPRRPLYVVVVNLFNQISLSAAERSAVLTQCETLLDRVCRLYGGRHERLPGTGLLIVLDALSESGDHAFQAICAALLAGRVFEDLNHERRRAGAVQLALRIGVERILEPDAQAAEAGRDPDDDALAARLPETVARGVTLSALARERSVVIGDAVREACSEPTRLELRPLQSPVLRAAGGGGAWLVDDLAEGYRSLLDRQAQLLLEAP